jgi:hypothetical protein
MSAKQWGAGSLGCRIATRDAKVASIKAHETRAANINRSLIVKLFNRTKANEPQAK